MYIWTSHNVLSTNQHMFFHPFLDNNHLDKDIFQLECHKNGHIRHCMGLRQVEKKFIIFIVERNVLGAFDTAWV
jgi:hypothetical protein